VGLLRTIFYCLKLRHDEKLSPEAIYRARERRLRHLVRYAKDRSPFFREHYRHVDPDAPDFRLEQLPPTSKDMLMSNFDRVVTRPELSLPAIRAWIRDPTRVGQWYLGRYVITHTSGTTGAPGIFAYDRREWDWVQAFSVTRGVRFKPSFGAFFRHAATILIRKVRVAMVSVLGGHFVTYVLFRLTPRIGKLASRFYYLPVVEPLPDLVARLNAIQPQVLHTYPTMLEILAHEAREGRLRIAPWVLSCSSEPLTRAARGAIQAGFPASPLFETYGTSEGVNLASECQRHDGLHVNEDYYVLEGVRADNQPVPAGQPADKLLLSCLFARTLPILRYEVNDVTTRLEEPCACGLPFQRIRVQGRTDDTFWAQDAGGQWVPLPPIPFEALFLSVPGLLQYQLVQVERQRLRVRVRACEPGAAQGLVDEVLQRMRAHLARCGLDDTVAVEVEPVAEIPRDPRSGKVRQILSLVERPFLPGRPLGERRSGEDRRSEEQPDLERDRREAPRRGQGEEP
jgi:phenylacetate-coenzyme A ligase PaaK-like adenylate-forming protein